MLDFFKTFREFMNSADLQEMATHYIEQIPLNFDGEDLEYLQQFELKDWDEAYKARMDALGEALKKLDEKRKPAIEEEKAKRLEELKLKYPSRDIESLEKAADKYAKDKLREGQFRHLPTMPNQDILELQIGNNVYKAKLYLNRLYHKLQTDYGKEHAPGSGLEGKRGEYGFDLHDIEKSGERHRTAGLNFPDTTTIKNRMNDWLNMNYHELFGSIRSLKDEKGNPIDPSLIQFKKTNIKDDFTIDERIKEIKKENERFDGRKRQSLTDSEAKSILMQEIEDGKLFSPNPKGFEIPESERQFRIEKNASGKDKIVKPFIWLPHILKTIKVKQGSEGAISEKDIWVPMVNASRPLKSIDKSDPQYKSLEQEGKLIGSGNTKYIYAPRGNLRGQTGVVASGSMQPNADSHECVPVSIDDPSYEEIYKKVFGDEGMIEGSGGYEETESEDGIPIIKVFRKSSYSKGGLRYDILKGMQTAIKNQYGAFPSGKSINAEDRYEVNELIRNRIIQNVEAIHAEILKEMMKCMGNAKLQNSDGRSSFAYYKLGGIIQKGSESYRSRKGRRIEGLSSRGRKSGLDRFSGSVHTARALNVGAIQDIDAIRSAQKEKLFFKNKINWSSKEDLANQFLSFYENSVLEAIKTASIGQKLGEASFDRDEQDPLANIASKTKAIDLDELLDDIIQNKFAMSLLTETSFEPPLLNRLQKETLTYLSKKIEEFTDQNIDKWEEWGKKMQSTGKEIPYSSTVTTSSATTQAQQPQAQQPQAQQPQAQQPQAQQPQAQQPQAQQPQAQRGNKPASQFEPKRGADGKINPKDLYSLIQSESHMNHYFNKDGGKIIGQMYDHFIDNREKVKEAGSRFHPEFNQEELYKHCLKKLASYYNRLDN